MIVQQFFVNGLAHSSYLLGGSDTCAIVDPRRDIQIYLDAAEAMNMEITHILETHLHADFISGHRDLAEITGAKIYAPKTAECQFDHVALSEGDTFEIEHVALKVLETPGHTPEHIGYVVTDTDRGDDPVALFCGDTLFVGDVGRPDLFPGMAEQLASQLYDSLHSKLLALPDFCEVYPAHGAGSLCGRAMGSKRTSTIGYERRYNSALQIKDRDRFIKSLTSNMPAAPDHFARCSAINAAGPTLVREFATPRLMDPKRFCEAAQQENTIIVDVRGYGAFGGLHVQGAYHMDIGGNFSTFAGWILPPEQNILLVTNTEEEVADAIIGLARVGLDHVVGYLDGGMSSWANAGLPIGHVGQLSAEELYEKTVGESTITIVDVRAPSEYTASHIKGSINIPMPDLRSRFSQLDPELPTMLLCSTGRRSSLGASLLQQRGFKDISNLAGGMTGYSAAGHAPECPMCFNPHGPHFLGRNMS